MGRPKALLPFGSETMLGRVVRLVGEAVQRVVVVSSPGQELPDLPAEVTVAYDRHPDRGPLEGLAVGLSVLKDDCGVAFVCACDVPLLQPGFVRRVLGLSAGYDIAVPHVDGFDHPLCAAYRPRILPHVEALLAAGRLRPAYLFEQIKTRRIGRQQLADVDPDLHSLANVNTPTDYRAALAVLQ